MKLNFANYGVGQVPAPSGALAVSASRVALDWLPPEKAAVVERLENLRLPEHAWDAGPELRKVRCFVKVCFVFPKMMSAIV